MKSDRATLVCDNCKFDLGENRKKKVRKKKAVDCGVKISYDDDA